MSQHVEEDGLDIVRADKVLAENPGVGAGTTIQRNRAAWAGAIFEPVGQVVAVQFRVTCRHDQLDDVFLDSRCHVHRKNFLASSKEIFLTDDAWSSRHFVLCLIAHELQDAAFGFSGRIAYGHMHQEAVELSFRQGISTFLLDWVLRCHDQEQGWQLERFTTHADLMLGHRLQKCGLHFGGSAVDLVGQNQVVENRTGLKAERSIFRPENLCAGDVAWQQVWSELNAMEVAFHSF